MYLIHNLNSILVEAKQALWVSHLTSILIWRDWCRSTVSFFRQQTCTIASLFTAKWSFETCFRNLWVNRRDLLASIWYTCFILQGIFPVFTPPQVPFFTDFSVSFLPHFKYLYPLPVLTKVPCKFCFPEIVQYLLFSPNSQYNLAAIKLVPKRYNCTLYKSSSSVSGT